MDQPELHHRKLHSKRSFHKHPRGPGFKLDSPAYDASEEDNDPLTDDSTHSASNGVAITLTRSSISQSSSTGARPSKLSRNGSSPSVGNGTGARQQHYLASSFSLSDDGVDSPTYDGDVESVTHTPVPTHSDAEETSVSYKTSHINNTLSPTSSVSTLSPLSASSPLPASSRSPSPEVRTPSASTDTQTDPLSHPTLSSTTLLSAAAAPMAISEPTPPAVAKEAFDPAALTAADIQAFVKSAIDGTDGTGRQYKINAPPQGRPVRVYADGVYDIFHFGHALQLRQAKLSFPSVHLLVGVCSDELVASHKSKSVMSHAERLESVRHCRWVDQVVPGAPWVITPEFLEEHEIDYVAHDEEPYAYASGGDVYETVKRLGKFIPTRRTPGISTSALLERIVAGYRGGDWDRKLEKLGRGDLVARRNGNGERDKEKGSMSGSEDGKKEWEVVEHGEP